MLNLTLKSQIKSHCLLKLNEESCGFIVNNSVFPCQNKAENKKHHFLIDGLDYLKASNLGSIQAVYHSHNSNIEFSDIDKINSNGFHLPLIQYNIKLNEFFVYYPNNEHNKYIGRNFQIGKDDCFSLIRDFYKNELNIQINNYERKEGWIQNSKYFFDTEYEKEGFIQVPKDKIQKNDIILIKYPNFPHAAHAAIYLGNDTMLHHVRNGFSKIEEYSNSYKNRTMMVLRHKSLC